MILASSKLLRFCLVAVFTSNVSGLTIVGPAPVVVEAPSTVSLEAMTLQSSNLPTQLELLDRIGSFTMAAATPAVATPSAKEAPKTTTSAPKASPSEISIVEIRFNGDIPKTEADEYVVVKNSSKNPIDVSGYYLYPATSGTQGSTFTFPKGSVIKPNASVRVYTNEIHKESGGYSWKSGKALWNNNGGLGVLKDNNGKKLGEYKYVPAKSA